ncbi:MAG TPA: hypothetical protein VF158_03910 [Longimicrobiales bacterium]
MQPHRAEVANGPFLVDAHVHFYPGYRRDPFLDGALANFRHHAGRLGLDPRAPAFLLLTETAEDHWFRALRDAAAAGTTGRWTFRATGDACSLIASRRPGEELVIIAGRQVAAREGLEVLAIGIDDDLPDGQPLRRTIERVAARGAVPVVPWGFGKWWFRRGALLRGLLERPPADALFLGDNGGRPHRFGTPFLFGFAAGRGIWTLPGSDPLPFPSHEARAGSNGFVLDGRLELDRPGESLKERLRALGTQPRPYGDGEAVPDFLWHQVVMQLRKRAWQARRLLAPR